MKLFATLVSGLILSIAASGAQAAPKALTEAQARAVLDPWYSQFTVATRGDVQAIEEKVVSPDFKTCNGSLPGECWGRSDSIRVISGLGNAIPDLKFELKEMIISGDRVTVLGEVSGTPVAPLFGQPATGKPFRMMTLDLQTIEDGKLTRTYHMENWLSALGQLRAK